MAEKSFRYVRCERAAAWEAAGWQVISGPLDISPPPGLEGSSHAVSMMIVEWAQAGHPVELATNVRRLETGFSVQFRGPGGCLGVEAISRPR